MANKPIFQGVIKYFDCKRFTPREWFIAPVEVIEQAIELIISGKIIDYEYDKKNYVIVLK